MAKMIPSKILAGTQSNAERKVYFALRDNLPDTFTVFHSVPLLIRDSRANALLPKEIDFLVCHPSHGLLVIEVKGGGIACDENKGVWTSTSSDGMVHEIKNPYQQAKSALYALRDELRDCGIGKKNCFPIAHAVWFPDIELGHVALGHSTNYADITFDNQALAAPTDLILHVIKNCQIWTAAKPPSHDGFQALVKYLAPKWQIPMRLGTALREEEKVFYEATRSQYKVLSMLGRKRRALICGAAGSGKTFLALEKAHSLAAGGNEVLLLCFNERLSHWLRDHLTLDKSTYSKLSVFHYHSLCGQFCRLADIPHPTPDPLSDLKHFFSAVLPETLLDALSATDKRFDAIVVDEGQDFEPLWWISIQELLRDPNHGHFYIFFDDNQNIYSNLLEFPIKDEPLVLCENCRNTQHIHAEIMKLYRGASENAPIGPEGRKPIEIHVSSDQEERQAVDNTLRNLFKSEGVPVESVVILTPRAQHKSKWRTDDWVAGHQLSWVVPTPANTIGCATIHSFKGLESPVVILSEMAESDQARLRHLAYVGSSRAKSHLIVIRRNG